MRQNHAMQEHIPADRLYKLLNKMWPEHIANRKFKELTGDVPPHKNVKETKNANHKKSSLDKDNH